MKDLSILRIAVAIAIYTIPVTASPACQQQKFSFLTNRVVEKPIPDITYLKANGSPFKVISDKSQVLIYIPLDEIDRVFSFVKTKLECEAGVAFAKNKEIERGLIASFFPLAFVGKRDRYLSLVADKDYVLPFQPSNENPLVVVLNIDGRS